MRKKVSMKDIAEQVGVSTALVSYVLNDKFKNRINAETAKKIKDLAESLNYRPNQIAKSLRNNKTYTLGLIIADISNLFSSNIARYIEDESKNSNYNVIFGSADENSEKFEELITLFISRQVDGIIIAAPEAGESQIIHLKEQKVPFILIDRIFPSIDQLSVVSIDNFKASYQVAEHLVEQGYENIGMITLASNLIHMKERLKGFLAGMNELSTSKANNIIEIDENLLGEKIEEDVLKLFKQKDPIDAIYFSTNKIAIEGLAVLIKHKDSLPQNIGIVCFDEADAYKIFHKSLTYVKQPLLEIGQTAVKYLLDVIEGKSGPQSKVFNAELVIKDSTSGKHIE